MSITINRVIIKRKKNQGKKATGNQLGLVVSMLKLVENKIARYQSFIISLHQINFDKS